MHLGLPEVLNSPIAKGRTEAMPKWLKRTLIGIGGFFALVFVIGFIAGPRPPAGSITPPQADRQESKPVPPATAAAPLSAEETTLARGWRVTDEVFRHARERSETAHSDCRGAVREAARWDYRSDWLPDYDWRTDGRMITIIGRDVHLQNAFGAYSNAPYICEWDLKKGLVVSVRAQ
jgi:hypothetical protein